MFRCEVCRGVVGPRVAQRKVTIYRKDRSIARELAVCAPCKSGFDEKPKVPSLNGRRRRKKIVEDFE